MSINAEHLDQALNILRERGHKLARKPGAFKAADGRTLVTIDGQLRTVQEIYEMAAFEEHKYDEEVLLCQTIQKDHPTSSDGGSRMIGLSWP